MEILNFIVGGLISFISITGKDWLIENKKEKEKGRQFKREKIEEIYMISKKMNDFMSLSMDYKIDANFADPTKLQMNVNLYFLDELGKEINVFLLDYEKAILEKMNNTFKQFDSSSFDTLIKKIIKTIKDI